IGVANSESQCPRPLRLSRARTTPRRSAMSLTASSLHPRFPAAFAPREVPNFRTAELAPRSTRYAVCVFVINEGERLHAQLRRMQALPAECDLIVADGGSTDRSVEPSVLATLGVNTLLVKTGLGRLSAQMRMAFAFALERGYEGVLCLDGNNKDDPAAIPS